MKTPIIATIIAAVLMAGCASLTPGQQATITTTEQTIATAATIAAPLVGNKTLSNYLYAISSVATAYGKSPVPTSIAAATAPIPGLAGVVLPLITGANNGPKTQALIAGAAQILATVAPAVTTNATSAAASVP